MRRVTVVISAVLVVFVFGCRDQQPVPEQQTITYFYEVICCSCEETPEQKQIANDVFALDRDFGHIEARAYDIYSTVGFEALKATSDRLGMEAVRISAPALVVDDEVFLGETAILAELDRLHGR